MKLHRVDILHVRDISAAYTDAERIYDHVFTYWALYPRDPDAIANYAFVMFNVGDDPERGEPHPLALAYRKLHNRSLSAGDALVIDGETYLSCERIGWARREPSEIKIGGSAL